MFLLDSDIVVWILRNDVKVTRAIEKLSIQGQLAVSTITIAEIFKNIFPEELPRSNNFFTTNTVFDVTSEIAKQSGYYWQDFHKKLANLSITDCIVAATAKNQNVKVVTLNTKHFPMKDIEVINPLS